MRRTYKIKALKINGKQINKLIVDPHVDKHQDHINDEKIKKIVASLDGGQYVPVKTEDGFQYFATNLYCEGKWYKLVWLLEERSVYIGILTLYRDRRIK